MKNFLTTVNAEMGANLLKQAQQQRNEDLGKLCIGQVQGIMLRIEASEARKQKDTANIGIYRRQLEAIDKGKMKIMRDQSGMVGIAFDDAELNDSVTGLMTNGAA